MMSFNLTSGVACFIFAALKHIVAGQEQIIRRES
jgi:hypothetical protein